ncbi:3'(2'),5'-bisphosphate nucleotidase CysQ [Devosia oryzisoli]|uniref:3'(2'),5'-bisphosphate nucleotidase CysQ n=1 Tax=Devosia oryzisoli TaxID=2774138 RepID=UPI0031F4BE68
MISSLADIALLSGQEILRIYGTEFVVETKADQSPVTLADVAAEAIIVGALRDAYPDIPVVAEEAAAAGRVPHTADQFFLVDPLDGSKEFISRNGEFTVNIALIENGEPVAGVVHAPAIGRIWWGGRAQGCFEAEVRDGARGAARPIAVRATEGALCAIGSRSHGSGEGDARLSRYPIATYLSAGSSLKFCLVASGKADIYPRFGRTMEWDTAAGDAILRAAGGRVECLDGSLLRYGKRNQADDTDFANPHFIAFGDTRFCALAS